MLLKGIGLCRNTGPGNQFPWRIDLVGEKKIYFMLNAYTAVISCSYYFHISDHTLSSLGAVLVSSQSCFMPLSLKETASLVAGLGGGSQPTEAAAAAATAAAWLCTSVLPQHLNLTRVNRPHSFSVFLQCDWTHTAAVVALGWTAMSHVKGEVWNSVTF